MSDTHTIVPGSSRTALAGARVLGRANTHAIVDVTLKIRRQKKLPELNGRPKELMSRKTLAETYGASTDDIERVSSVLGKFGLKTLEANPATRTVKLSGTVAAMEDAFEVSLFNYAHPSGNYRGRVGNVHVPAELDGIVKGVFGLDTRRVAHRKRPPLAAALHGKTLSSVPASWYTPNQLAAHYEFPAGDGNGQTVGILEFGGGYFPGDLEAFCQLASVSMPQVKAISTDGTSTAAKDGAEGEVMLDVEVIAGVCPKANIVMYFAHFTEQGWITALDAAAQDEANDPSVISVSWGYAEDADIWTEQAMTQVNETLQELAHLGVTVCVAAGDDGSSDGILDGHAHADFPSSSPFVLSVGGTTIPAKNGDQPDIAWREGDGLRQDNGGSTGGAVSSVFPRPVWQSNVPIKSVNRKALLGRCIPDIAANADWDASPYLLVVDGQAQPNGGTSAATPLCTALIALINQNRGPGKRIGFLTPLLYQSQNGAGSTIGQVGCTDVVSGNNITSTVGGYKAGPGYDAVSGWGTPNGTKLLQALA
jgi:kumamolisin